MGVFFSYAFTAHALLLLLATHLARSSCGSEEDESQNSQTLSEPDFNNAGSCEYEKFTPDHTMCKPPSDTCHVIQTGISDEDKALIVNEHNKYRSKVAMGQEESAGGLPTAANMIQLTWDDELAKVAQRHAEQCRFEHDCNDCRRVDRFSVGQNIESGSSTVKYEGAGWEDMIKSLYDEVQYFDRNSISPFQVPMQGNTYLHFTQVVWATTTKVGCGWVQYENEGAEYQYSKLMVCDYGPAGNMIGGDMYKIGEPCSACPENTCCGTSCSDMGIENPFEGLCASV